MLFPEHFHADRGAPLHPHIDLAGADESLFVSPDTWLIPLDTSERESRSLQLAHISAKVHVGKHRENGFPLVRVGDPGFWDSRTVKPGKRTWMRRQDMRAMSVKHPMTTLTASHGAEFVMVPRDGGPWPRRLSVLEHKRVGGFPDSHVLAPSYGRACRQVGNAVVPAVVEAVARDLGLTRGFRFVDLFCGIGGFHVGLARLGGECVFAADFDKHAAAAYTANFGMEAFRDVSEVKKLPEHDLLCGGFPCQDFSVAGAKAGLGGARSSLFYEVVRLAEQGKPQYLLLENVKQAVSYAGDKIRLALNNIGYRVQWHTLNAADYGVPQARERTYFVATRM